MSSVTSGFSLGSLSEMSELWTFDDLESAFTLQIKEKQPQFESIKFVHQLTWRGVHIWSTYIYMQYKFSMSSLPMMVIATQVHTILDHINCATPCSLSVATFHFHRIPECWLLLLLFTFFFFPLVAVLPLDVLQTPLNVLLWWETL